MTAEQIDGQGPAEQVEHAGETRRGRRLDLRGCQTGITVKVRIQLSKARHDRDLGWISVKIVFNYLVYQTWTELKKQDVRPPAESP